MTEEKNNKDEKRVEENTALIESRLEVFENLKKDYIQVLERIHTEVKELSLDNKVLEKLDNEIKKLETKITSLDPDNSRVKEVVDDFDKKIEGFRKKLALYVEEVEREKETALNKVATETKGTLHIGEQKKLMEERLVVLERQLDSLSGNARAKSLKQEMGSLQKRLGNLKKEGQIRKLWQGIEKLEKDAAALISILKNEKPKAAEKIEAPVQAPEEVQPVVEEKVVSEETKDESGKLEI